MCTDIILCILYHFVTCMRIRVAYKFRVGIIWNITPTENSFYMYAKIDNLAPSNATICTNNAMTLTRCYRDPL